MNPPSPLARQLHVVLSGARGLTLLHLSHRIGLTVPEAYPGLRWLLRWGFAESKARIGREAVYVAVKGKTLPPAPARPPRVRVRKPDSYGKPPVGWDAANDLQERMKKWIGNMKPLEEPFASILAANLTDLYETDTPKAIDVDNPAADD